MSDAAIDEAVLRDLEATAGAEFVAELVATFRAEAPTLLAQLNDAHAKQDAATFRRAAHSLKSNAATFGAVTLAKRARDLETGGLGVASADVLASLDTDYARAAAELSLMTKA